MMILITQIIPCKVERVITPGKGAESLDHAPN
jgi:hypothetical protein